MISRVVAFLFSFTLFLGVGLAMRPAGHLACMMPVGMPAVSAQSMPSPPEGNPNHEEPAPGTHCVHDNSDPAHNCACHRKCETNKDDNGNDTQGQHVVEDSKCRHWCFMKTCLCPTENCELS